MKNINIHNVAIVSCIVIGLSFIFMCVRTIDYRARMQDREESYISKSDIADQKAQCTKTGGVLFGRRVATGDNMGKWHSVFCEYDMTYYNNNGVNNDIVSVNGYWEQKSDYVVVK